LDHNSLKEVKHYDTILVLDFGGQYCHLIARRIRELRVYSEIAPSNISPTEIQALQKQHNIKGIIFSGGPASVYNEGAPSPHNELFSLNIPILGLCYGHQLIVKFFGGEVRQGKTREYGVAQASIDSFKDILSGLDRKEKVWMSHYDTVIKLPQDFDVLARTEHCPIAAFSHRVKPIYGLQWHPEVVHTAHGKQILQNFIFKICKCQANWKPVSLIDSLVAEIQEIVAEKRAIIALSGGVDSSTATLLATRAIGQNLTAIFVDHGFMRKGEPLFVEKTFKEFGVNLITIHAQDRFYTALHEISDPEEKRIIIGNEFIKVFEEVAAKIGAEYLIQGTIYPDRIESGFRDGSAKIKSHHNVSGIPPNITFRAIVEPLRDLYKDEVRELATALGLSHELTRRQPFPGPGLAVRIIGEATPTRVKVLQEADEIVRGEIERVPDINARLWQYFAILTNTQSTGVKGDARAYGWAIAIRIVESREAMTANFARIPYDVLEAISTRITNEVPQITRVVYDITNKPPATIEWE
jgi:GMP synthase (glutamine-hydrolysing)